MSEQPKLENRQFSGKVENDDQYCAALTVYYPIIYYTRITEKIFIQKV